MKYKLIALSRHYAAELRKHLQSRSKTGSHPAAKLGRRAVALGLETLELARMHEQALVTLKTPAGSPLFRRAELFFAEAIAPIVDTHRAARQNNTRLNRLNILLKRRTAELAATNHRLKEGIDRRRDVEASLKQRGDQYEKLLTESIGLQEDLRRMTRQMLAAQEEERISISRELQNEIAQTLLGINVRLLTLKRQASGNAQRIKDEIIAAQELAEKTAGSTRRRNRKQEAP
jgi:signal transduction histidine kinase